MDLAKPDAIAKEILEHKKKISQLRERQRIEAAKLKRNLKRQQKIDDDRKKILYGVGLLEAIRHGRISEYAALDMINQSITRPTDREFLGLDPATK